MQKVVRFHALADGRFAVESVYDVQDIVDRAARVRALQQSGWKGDTHCVGIIPMHMHQQMRADGRIHDPKAIAAWLREHSKFEIKKVYK